MRDGSVGNCGGGRKGVVADFEESERSRMDGP